MNPIENVLEYAADQAISTEEAPKNGMEENYCVFAQKSAEVYAKA